MMNSIPTLEPTLGPDGVLDVCTLPCSIKHGLIIRTCLGLPVGGSFVLVNGHNPLKVLHQIAAEWPAAFVWEHLSETPEECRVRIAKVKPAEPKAQLPAAPSCSH